MTLTPGHCFRQSHHISQINNQRTRKLHVVSAKRRKNEGVQVKNCAALFGVLFALSLYYIQISQSEHGQSTRSQRQGRENQCVHVKCWLGFWGVLIAPARYFWQIQQAFTNCQNVADNSTEELFPVTSFSIKVDYPRTLSLLSIFNRKQREISKLIYSQARFS